MNNLFKIGIHNVTEYEITIYSRAGLMVYHSTEISESWDGTHKGIPCVSGSYVYKIRYRTQAHGKKQLEKVGTVLLLR